MDLLEGGFHAAPFEIDAVEDLFVDQLSFISLH
jgi:hypothetical protein